MIFIKKIHNKPVSGFISQVMIFVFLINFIMPQVIFLQKKYYIQKEVREKILNIYKGNSLTRILVKGLPEYLSLGINYPEELEFNYHGRLYDIVKIEQNGDLFEITALSDEKEEELINEFTNEDDDKNLLKFLKVIKFFDLEFLPLKIGQLLIYNRTFSAYIKSDEGLIRHFPENHTPPPKKA